MKNVLDKLFLIGLVCCISVGYAQKETTTAVPSSLVSDQAGWRNNGTWLKQHEDINRIGENGKVDLVFLGNSITQSWGGQGRDVWLLGQKSWNANYQNRNAANFGISGDCTQHILWRIENGNFDHISPKVIVLMAGTNNLPHNGSKDIAKGVKAILRQLRRKCPKAEILLLGIFPRGEGPQDPLRKKMIEVNERIAHFQRMPKVTYVDIGTVFLKEDGAPDPNLMRADNVHLSENGYQAWATAIEPFLKELLNEDDQK
jgi:lysophospholipase L1-like esterase